MSEFLTTAEENVSAAKGVQGGYCFRAPVGTPLPDSPSWRPQPVYTLTADTDVDAAKTYCTKSGSGKTEKYTEVETPAKASLNTYYEKHMPWKNMGFITEDGEKWIVEVSTQEFFDQNGDTMDTSQSKYGEGFGCAFAETKAAPFESIYGKDAVTDENGVLKVNHTGAEPDTWTYAFLFLLKDGRKWVRYAEKCKRTEITEYDTNSSTVVAWAANYKALKSETTGGYFVDLFESTETEATDGN